MTTLALNYVVNPFTNFFSNLWVAISLGLEIRGYVKAAQELQRLGFHTEAKQAMTYARELASK
jgi:hypothetical protein